MGSVTDFEVQLVLPLQEICHESVEPASGFLHCIRHNLHEKSEMVKLFVSYSSSGIKEKLMCKSEVLAQVRTSIFKSLFYK